MDFSPPRERNLVSGSASPPSIAGRDHGNHLAFCSCRPAGRSARKTGLDAKIKWPNDVVIGTKKVCGILTELSAEWERVHYLIVGIGVNVNQSAFPPLSFRNEPPLFPWKPIVPLWNEPSFFAPSWRNLSAYISNMASPPFQRNTAQIASRWAGQSA